MSYYTSFAANFLFWTFVPMFGGVSATAFAQDNNPAPISVNEYIERLQKQRAEVKSMKLTFESKLEYDPVLVKARRLNGYTIWQKTSVAFKGEKRWCQTNAKELTSQPAPREIERLCVFDGSECRTRVGKGMDIQRAKSGYSELNLYFSGLLWPATDVEVENSKARPEDSLFLPYFLQTGNWTSQDEDYGGAMAVRLYNADNTRQLWLDPRHGYALLRYEQINPVATDSKWTFTYQGLTKVLPNFYLPGTIVGTQELLDLESKKPLGKVTSTITLLDMQVNDVPDSLFRLDPMPGDVICDNDRRVVYTYMPLTDQTLDSNIKKSQAERINRHQVQSVSASRPWILINVFVVIFLICLFLGRRSSKTGRP